MRVGYKTLDDEWNGDMGFHYELGAEYADADPPVVGESGFHYCESLWQLSMWRLLEEGQQVIIELEILGEPAVESIVCASSHVRVIREVPWDEVLRELDHGRNNSGLRNIGNDNKGEANIGNGNEGSGNRGDSNHGYTNSGSGNIGHYNIGHQNIGSSNNGINNIGNANVGGCNIGNENAGDHNFGNGCAGKCNMCSWVAGAFNTESRFMMFNKPVDFAHKAFLHVPAYVWEVKYPPADEIVKPNGTCEVEPSENRKREVWYEAWRRGFEAGMSNARYDSLWDTLSLPNFSFTIFEQITGISKKMIQQEMKKLTASEFARLNRLVRKARP